MSIHSCYNWAALNPLSYITKGRRVFYGWWMVLAGLVFMAYNAGTWWYSFGVLFKPIASEFNWSRAATSGAFSVSNLEGGFVGPLIGWAIDRLGPKRVILFGVLLSALGFAALSRIDSLLGFYLTYVLLIGLGAYACGLAPNMAVAARWFERKRGMAMGLMAVGPALGGFIMTQVVAWLILLYGWRVATPVIGAGMLAFGIPLWMIVRNHGPEHYGLLPDGEERAAPQPTNPLPTLGEEAKAVPTDFSALEALRTRAFWLLVLVLLLSGGASSGLSVHAAVLLNDKGVPMQAAALGIGILTITGAPGRLAMPWLGDWLDLRLVFSLCLAISAVGLFGMVAVSDPAMVYLSLALFGFGSGGTMPLRPTIIASYYGGRSFATIHGWGSSFAQVGSMVGPLFLGWVFDVSGSYNVALAIYGVASAASAALILLARRPAHPESPAS